MSEKDASEEQILDYLESVFESEKPLDIDHTIKGIAKVLYQYIMKISELKVELLKVFKPDGEEKDEKLEEIVNGSFYT